MHEAWRLNLTYDGEEWRLQSLRRLDKRLPAGQGQEAADRFGWTVELRGKGKEVLFRRAIDHLLPETAEYPTGDPARPLGRVPFTGRRGVSVLVPHLPGALSVAVVERRRGAKPGRTTRARTGEPERRDVLVVDLPRVQRGAEDGK